MSNYKPGAIDLTSRAERVPNLQRVSGHDPRDGDQFSAGLAAETEHSLRRSPRWRAGLPLEENERWPRVSLGDIGGGRNIDSRDGRSLDRAGQVRWGQ